MAFLRQSGICARCRRTNSRLGRNAERPKPGGYGGWVGHRPADDVPGHEFVLLPATAIEPIERSTMSQRRSNSMGNRVSLRCRCLPMLDPAPITAPASEPELLTQTSRDRRLAGSGAAPSPIDMAQRLLHSLVFPVHHQIVVHPRRSYKGNSGVSWCSGSTCAQRRFNDAVRYCPVPAPLPENREIASISRLFLSLCDRGSLDATGAA